MGSVQADNQGIKRRRRRRGAAQKSSGIPAACSASALGKLAHSIEPAIATAISIAKVDIEECALILRHAEDLAAHGRTRLALTHALDVEPRLFETQHLLNAAARLHRVLKETSSGT